MAARQIIKSAGYFTWLDRLYDKTSPELEKAIGFSAGSLRNGWQLYTPRAPIAASNIDLRGSTRYSDGKMPDGRQIAEVLANRTAFRFTSSWIDLTSSGWFACPGPIGADIRNM